MAVGSQDLHHTCPTTTEVLVGGVTWDTGAGHNAVRCRTLMVAWSRPSQGAAPRLHWAAALGRHRQQQRAAP
jgi:hypothetical protein